MPGSSARDIFTGLWVGDVTGDGGVDVLAQTYSHPPLFSSSRSLILHNDGAGGFAVAATPESWTDAFYDVLLAEEAARNGHRQTASEAYLRAFTYIRVAELMRRPDDPQKVELYRRAPVGTRVVVMAEGL